MPFTLSHPAAASAVWPLVRRARLPLAALAVGTMTPDFEYFVHLRPLALWSHSLAGVAWFCLPAGLAVLAAWEWVVREPVRRLLGLDGTATAAAAPAPAGDARWWARAAVAILVGALTHLLWDGLTHGGYWGAQLFPALRSTAFSLPDGRAVPWYNALQHASTAVGGAVVLAWLGRRLRDAGAVAHVARSPRRLAALGVIAVAAAAAGVLNALRFDVPSGYWGAQLWLGRAAVGAMLGLGVSLLAYSVAQRAIPDGVTTPAAGRRR